MSRRGDDFYIGAFWELCSERSFSVGMGGHVMGPIPWSSIIAYGVTQGLDGAMLRTFVGVVRELDEYYLEHDRDGARNRLRELDKQSSTEDKDSK